MIIINKEILSEISLYYGDVKMPHGFDIEKEQLIKDTIISELYNINFPFSIPFDMLKTYVTDHMKAYNNIDLIYKKTWGNGYNLNETSLPLKQIDPVDLKNSPDFVLLYGIEIDPKTCDICIFYNDNRRKGKTWTIPLETNKFVMFPSSLLYCIKNKKNLFSNYIQTITFDYI
jgi:hypothetical protein